MITMIGAWLHGFDRAEADRLGRYHIPKPDRSRANGHNVERQEAMALLQVDNDRVSIKLKLPQDGPSSRDERGCSTGGPWVLPSSSGRYQSASRDIEPLRNSEDGSSDSQIAPSRRYEHLGPSFEVSPAGRNGVEHLDGDAKRVDSERPAESSDVRGRGDPQQNARVCPPKLIACEICSRCRPSSGS